MGFNTASIWLKISLVCFLLGTLLFVIGFATNKWQVLTISWYGLWSRHYCVRGYRHAGYTCGEHKITSAWLENNDHATGDNWTAMYRSTQVFECVGLICAILGLIIAFIFIFVDSMRKRSALIAVIILGFVAAVAMCIGFVIFGTFFDFYETGWSMGIAIAGAIVIFVGAVMAVIDLKK